MDILEEAMTEAFSESASYSDDLFFSVSMITSYFKIHKIILKYAYLMYNKNYICITGS